MAIIPLKQTVVATSPSGTDGWGQPIPGTTVTYKARVSEQTNVVANQAGQEAVTSLRIFIDKLPAISYDHDITYTNELGVTIKRKPVKIAVLRGLNGKAILTEVYV